MLFPLLLGLLIAAQQTPSVPLPPSHRPFGPATRDEVLEGWETFIEDVPQAANCEDLGKPMVRALNPPHREEAVAMLLDVPFREIDEDLAARLVGVERRRGEALATTMFDWYLDQMRQRKHQAEVERRGSWSTADQNDLDRLTARFDRGDHRAYRPYLVRAVSKFGDGHGGAPFMFGDLCGDDLHLQTLVFSYTIPPSERVPAVVFLPRPPRRVIASVRVAW